MPEVVLSMSMSLDGYVCGPDVSEEHAMGRGGERLHRWIVPQAGADGPRPEDAQIVIRLGRGFDARERRERAAARTERAIRLRLLARLVHAQFLPDLDGSERKSARRNGRCGMPRLADINAAFDRLAAGASIRQVVEIG